MPQLQDCTDNMRSFRAPSLVLQHSVGVTAAVPPHNLTAEHNRNHIELLGDIAEHRTTSASPSLLGAATSALWHASCATLMLLLQHRREGLRAAQHRVIS